MLNCIAHPITDNPDRADRLYIPQLTNKPHFSKIIALRYVTLQEPRKTCSDSSKQISILFHTHRQNLTELKQTALYMKHLL